MSRRSLVAALVAALSLLALSASAAPARAAVPNRVYGSVTLNGQPAPVGTTIVALAGGKQCASTTVTQLAVSGTTYPYKLDVPDGSAAPSCLPGAVLTFTVGGVTAGQTFTLDDVGTFLRMDLTAPGTPNVPVAASSNVNLTVDCTQVTSSFADGTTPQAIAQAVTPTGTLIAIWKFDATTGAYRGFSPATSFASDLASVNRNDALRICVSAAATLSLPS